jgi:hypothetical protein
MLVRSAMIVWAMAAIMLPVTPASAAEAAPGSRTPATESATSIAAAFPAPTIAAEDFLPDAKPGGLVYTPDARAPEARPGAPRFDFAQRPAPATPLWLAPAPSAARPGWALSGRAGVLRWLTPIDGEGGTTIRLFGRIADQPRTPGLGTFNLSLHYSFE